MLVLLAACDRDPPDPAPREVPRADLVLTDAHTYRLTGMPRIEAVPVGLGVLVTADWCGLTSTLWGDPLPGSTGMAWVSLAELALAPDEVVSGLAGMGFTPSDIVGELSWETAGCTADLDVAEVLAPVEGTWLLTVSDGLQGLGAAILEPRAGAAAVVEITDDTAAFGPPLDLHSARPVTAPPDGPWILDWSALTRDAHGDPFDPMRAGTLIVAWYAGPVVRLEAGLDPLGMANAHHVADVTGRRWMDLGDPDAFSLPFTGFTDEGTWMLALCDDCDAAPPPVLARAEVALRR